MIFCAYSLLKSVIWDVDVVSSDLSFIEVKGCNFYNILGLVY